MESSIALMLRHLDYFTDYLYFNRESLTVSGYIFKVAAIHTDSSEAAK